MFGIFKKKDKEPKTPEEQLVEEVKEQEESKSFFSKALEKTIGNIATIVPKKKEKIEFDTIEELLIEADMEYEIVELAMDGLPEMITREQLRHRLVSLFEHAPDVDMEKNILLYLPLDMEVDVRGLINYLRRKKNYNIFVPYMIGETFKIVPYRLPLSKKKYNILEPNNSNFKYNVELDLAIVPIVGCDDSFRRVGFGVGFYDRFFASLKKKPKVVFTQLCLCKSTNILTQDHDVQADYIITNKGILWKKS
jgi:5-formyltetrahydrofolate cyclo-ligase